MSRRPLEDVRAEPRERARVQLEHGAVPEDALGARRRAARATACRARGSPRGRTVQRPVMRRCERRTTPPSKRSTRFLPMRLDRFEHAGRRSARRRAPTCARGMRRLDLEPLADERLQAPGRAVERVALGHAATVTSVADCPSRCCRDSDPQHRRADPADRRAPGHDPQVGAAVRRPAPRADRRRPAPLHRARRRARRVVEGAARARATGSARRRRCSGRDDHVPLSAEELRDAIVDATLRDDVAGLADLVEQAFSTLVAARVVLRGARAGADRGRRALGSRRRQRRAGAPRDVDRARRDAATARRARADVRGIAVLACAPGEQHEIGLLMLAVLLRADGWQVAYLGADTPVLDAVALAERSVRARSASAPAPPRAPRHSRPS